MRLFRLTLLASIAAVATLMSCGKQVPIEDPEGAIVVSYSTVSGSWELTWWNGTPLSDDTILYIDLDRTERRFEMWDNIGSMYPVCTTGTFLLTAEEDGSYTLSGSYDHGVGDWNDEYRVEMLSADRMQWWSRTNGDVLDFMRIESIPELY